VLRVFSVTFVFMTAVAPISEAISTTSFTKTAGDEEEAIDGLVVGEIAFKLERNRVILPLCAGNDDTLDMLLDTGMRFDGVYLFHKEVEDLFGVEVLDLVRVGGAGSGEATYALMADSMTLTFGDVSFDNQLVVISQSQTTQGFPTDGVTGYTLYDVPTAFAPAEVRSKQEGADGIIGNDALRRFYSGQRLYIRPNRPFGKSFDVRD
jgi:hypothetical protein